MVYNLAVMVSGGGTNLQALIDASAAGGIRSKICLVISNKEDAYALERARSAGIPAQYIHHTNQEELGRTLSAHNIDLIMLAGYLQKIPAEIIEKYRGRILNIHPSLLPKYGGKGFYGMNVHRAVLNAGDAVSGATIFYVDENYDTGRILIQQQTDISGLKTAEDIAAAVLETEHKIIVESIRRLEYEKKSAD